MPIRPDRGYEATAFDGCHRVRNDLVEVFMANRKEEPLMIAAATEISSAVPLDLKGDVSLEMGDGHDGGENIMVTVEEVMMEADIA